MAKKQFTISDIKLSKLPIHTTKILAGFGGMVGGKILSHFLNKAITSKAVSGLVGMEMSTNVAKYVKPAIIVGLGAATFQAGDIMKNEPMQYAGIGCAGIGFSDVFTAFTGKDALAGIDEVFDEDLDGFGDVEYDFGDVEYDNYEDFEDVPESPQLELPDLNGNDELEDDYIAVNGNDELEDDYIAVNGNDELEDDYDDYIAVNGNDELEDELLNENKNQFVVQI